MPITVLTNSQKTSISFGDLHVSDFIQNKDFSGNV